jgi:hypothetical protein
MRECADVTDASATTRGAEDSSSACPGLHIILDVE